MNLSLSSLLRLALCPSRNLSRENCKKCTWEARASAADENTQQWEWKFSSLSPPHSGLQPVWYALYFL
ncbi:hypothetical protein TorRG33x02_230510 [Trema orientale]|uniref:Uncharacterized protein n=1 Tax=Trema orientale TaxID=63057 RepID=A0A2P5E6I9_TREOI|nr:hypothetical protein TorRG33x02_230510 [Trema orientale]